MKNKTSISAVEEKAVPLDVKQIQTGDVIESIPEEPQEALKPRLMGIPPAPSRQEVLEH